MTILTTAITSHELEKVEQIILGSPSLASEEENGWLPIEWAEKTGNVFTFTRTARLLVHLLSEESAKKFLKEYVSVITSTEFEPISSEKSAEMIWLTVFKNASFKVDRWERPLFASSAHVSDVKYLIQNSGISTAKQLKQLIENA